MTTNKQHSQSIFDRFIFGSGEPGAGKSEAVVYAAFQAAKDQCRVLIGCLTGVLASGYRDRLPASERITAETIHAAWTFSRDKEQGTYNPPSRLKNYDLLIIDEVSQLDNHIFRLLFYP